MFRNTLLATTALVLGASVANAGTVHHGIMANSKNHPKFLNLGVPGHMGAHGLFPIALGTGHTDTKPVHNNVLHAPKAKNTNFSSSPNGQWISWYGYNAIGISECEEISSNYHYCDTETGNNAIPVTLAKEVKKATITIPLFSETGSSTVYDAGVYSSVSGLPGGPVAVGTITGASDNEYCCTNARTTGNLGNIKAGSYFVELSCPAGSTYCEGGWDMEDTDFSGATVDYWHVVEKYSTVYYSTVYKTTISSPWHASTYYPTAGAYSIN